MRTLNVLVACEESGAVRDEFRKLGHNAWSCDLQPCDPASPFRDYHLQGDLLQFLNRNYAAVECFDWGQCFKPKHIDLMIAHPPCTYLCNSGVRWLFRDPTPLTSVTRSAKMRVATTKGIVFRVGAITRSANAQRLGALNAAAAFFRRLILLAQEIPSIALENPIMHGYARAMIGCGKPDQIIQPWMFGDMETKATCLWLKRLPKLVPTHYANSTSIKHLIKHSIHKCPPGPDRAKIRSRTFHGIAVAMAQQWSEYIQNL